MASNVQFCEWCNMPYTDMEALTRHESTHTKISVLYEMHEMYQSGIHTSWKDLKHVTLLDDRQREEDRRWDLEFIRRRNELDQQRQISNQRRVRTTSKLTELSSRWHNVEQKRVEKNELYLERLRTSLSLALRQESQSSGSPYIDR